MHACLSNINYSPFEEFQKREKADNHVYLIFLCRIVPRAFIGHAPLSLGEFSKAHFKIVSYARGESLNHLFKRNNFTDNGFRNRFFLRQAFYDLSDREKY